MGKISIGGKEFFGSAEFMLDADTVTSDQPGDDSSFITDMGVGPLTIRVRGDCTEETDSLSDVRKEIMTVGELSLILDIGWEYRVFRRSFRPVRIAGAKQTGLNGYHNEFEATFVCEEPYQFTTTDNTRSYAVTANNETWTADDSGNALSTDGEVDAVPDIQVTGDAAEALDIDQQVGATFVGVDSLTNYGQTFTPTGIDITKVIVKVVNVNTAGNITLTVWDSPTMNTNMGSKVVNITATGETAFEFATAIPLDTSQPYFRLTSSAADIDFVDSNANPYAGGAQYKDDGIMAGDDMWFKVYMTKTATRNPSVYNTADSTVQCDVANTMLSDAVHRINADGTGTIDYNDDCSTPKYQFDGTLLNVTYDATNDEIDIADDGYIYYAIDCKYPVTGIPTLTSQINNTAAVLPTIQISDDAATWYDIDTTVVDDVDTSYELDDSTNLSLKGLTLFYFRIDCAKAASAQGCSVKSFELDVDLVTIDAENPLITEGGSASTFQCDQHANSGLECTILLTYSDKRWPG